jgi:hypothetical protein
VRGRKPKLADSGLRVIEVWNLTRPFPAKTIAGKLGICLNTFWDAVYRRRAYRETARG